MDEYLQIIKDLQKRVSLLEKALNIDTLIFTSEGVLVIPVVTADPVSPQEGQIWYNTTSNTFKCYDGTIKTFTIS